MKPIYREDGEGKTIKMYLSEVDREDLEAIQGNISSVREDIRPETERFVADCLEAFAERKRVGGPADRYAREFFGVDAPLRDVERCCVAYAPYRLADYCEEEGNAFADTRKRLDVQIAEALRG